MKNFLTFSFCLINSFLYAQQPTLVWAKSLGGTSLNDFSRSIAVDASGNVYTTGSFFETADFDPGPGTFYLTGGIFVSKLDASGNFVWAKKMGSSGRGHSITVDSSGNVYTTGTFGNTADFDPGPETFNLIGFGIFVSKLDASGNFVWAKQMSGFSGGAIAVDASGNVYTTGGFSDTADFDPGPGIFNLTGACSSNVSNTFVSKLDRISIAGSVN